MFILGLASLGSIVCGRNKFVLSKILVCIFLVAS